MIIYLKLYWLEIVKLGKLRYFKDIRKKILLRNINQLLELNLLVKRLN